MTLFFFTSAQPDKQKVLNRGSPNLWVEAPQKATSAGRRIFLFVKDTATQGEPLGLCIQWWKSITYGGSCIFLVTVCEGCGKFTSYDM